MGGLESPRSARPDSALTQLSPRGRNVPPFSPAGKGPVRQYNTVRHDGTISPRRSFMGPCAPIPAVEAPKGAPTARPKKKKGPDPHWMTSNELTHINFVKKGMVKPLPQFDIPELPEGVVPPMTPSMREKMLLEKGPDVNHTRSNGFTALLWACQEGHAPCAQLLLDGSAKLKYRRCRAEVL